MKKNSIITLILVVSLCFFSGIMGVRGQALPICNFDTADGYGTITTEFNTFGIDNLKTQSAVRSGFSCNDCFMTNNFKNWGENTTRQFEMTYLAGGELKNTIQSVYFTIYSGDYKDNHYSQKGTAVCQRSLKLDLQKTTYYQYNIKFKISRGNVLKVVANGTYKDSNDEIKKFDEASIYVLTYGTDVEKSVTTTQPQESDHDTDRDHDSVGRTYATTVESTTSAQKNNYYTDAPKGSSGYKEGKIDCSKISGAVSLIKIFWKAVMILVPVILMALGTLDFVKGFTSNDADAAKKSATNFVKRTIAALLLLFLPVIIGILISLFGLINYNCLK